MLNRASGAVRQLWTSSRVLVSSSPDGFAVAAASSQYRLLAGATNACKRESAGNGNVTAAATAAALALTAVALPVVAQGDSRGPFGFPPPSPAFNAPGPLNLSPGPAGTDRALIHLLEAQPEQYSAVLATAPVALLLGAAAPLGPGGLGVLAASLPGRGIGFTPAMMCSHLP